MGQLLRSCRAAGGITADLARMAMSGWKAAREEMEEVGWLLVDDQQQAGGGSRRLRFVFCCARRLRPATAGRRPGWVGFIVGLAPPWGRPPAPPPGAGVRLCVRSFKPSD